MSISQEQTAVENNDNETVTLIALPLHLFQQATQNNQLIVEHNVLIKTLPDGSLVLDTNQVKIYFKNMFIIMTTKCLFCYRLQMTQKSFLLSQMMITLQQKRNKRMFHLQKKTLKLSKLNLI